jgi:hypothetical protein
MFSCKERNEADMWNAAPLSSTPYSQYIEPVSIHRKERKFLKTAQNLTFNRGHIIILYTYDFLKQCPLFFLSGFGKLT